MPVYAASKGGVAQLTKIEVVDGSSLQVDSKDISLNNFLLFLTRINGYMIGKYTKEP